MENEILDQPIVKDNKKPRLAFLFWIASLFLGLRYLFFYLHYPYSNVLLVLAGIFYEAFSILRLIYYPKKSLFQVYSYIFFLLVIPGFILNYLKIPEAKFLLLGASAVPIVFFVQLLLGFYKRK